MILIHNLAEIIWPLFVNVVKFGSGAYIITKGLIGTLRDLVDGLILLLQD